MAASNEQAIFVINSHACYAYIVRGSGGFRSANWVAQIDKGYMKRFLAFWFFDFF